VVEGNEAGQALAADTAALSPQMLLSIPVAQALAVIGDRWTLLAIRDVFLGFRRFEDLRRRGGVARGTLTSRLKALVDAGILCRVQYQLAPPRDEYRLTEKGLGLYPVILTIWRWEQRWGGDQELPRELVHRNCGQRMEPQFVCSECGEEVAIGDTRYTLGSADRQLAPVPPRSQRRTRASASAETDVDGEVFQVLDIIGDRWTGLVQAAAYFGLRRYDDIAATLGIATSILADRLKLLVHEGIMERRAYQLRPARYEYRLTPKGRDLYPIAVAMHDWARRWLVADADTIIRLEHRPCGSVLVGRCICSACGEELQPAAVRFARSNPGTATPPAQ